MRLLHSETIELKEFHGDNIPPYAILSHTWGDDEVSFQDMKEQSVAQQKAGYTKIKYCCAQAVKDKLEWAWVDTCCIDKSSSAELSEAINSMFRWYQNARVCYAYLSDVSDEPDAERQRLAFGKSRWFTRGWTLQELLAPEHLVFYDNAWHDMGSKAGLRNTISRITGIDEETLNGRDLAYLSVAEKMFWASKRRTTRTEDVAYCLMGIFDVNMPLLYGEGKKAFIRLQEEIIKDSEDQSLFVWMALGESECEGSTEPQAQGLLAQSPAAFASSGSIVPFRVLSAPYSMTNRGLRIALPLLSQEQAGVYTALLWCRERHDSFKVFAIDIRCIKDDKFSRIDPRILRILPSENVSLATVKTVYIKNERVIFSPQNYFLGDSFQIRTVPSTSQGYSLAGLFPAKHWSPALKIIRSTFLQPLTAGLLFEGPKNPGFGVILGFPTVESRPWCIILSGRHNETLEDMCTIYAKVEGRRKLEASAASERAYHYHMDLGSVKLVVRLVPELMARENVITVDIAIEEKRSTMLSKLKDVI